MTAIITCFGVLPKKFNLKTQEMLSKWTGYLRDKILVVLEQNVISQAGGYPKYRDKPIVTA